MEVNRLDSQFPQRCRLMTHLLRGSGHVLTSLVYFKIRIITKNSWLLRMVPESVGSLLGYCSNRKMLVWCWFLLQFFFHLIGATPEICKKQSPCNAPECFKMRGSPEPACTSTNQTHLCRIDGSYIEYNCDADLSCKCNGRPFELAGQPTTPEVAKGNNSPRIKSFGLLVLLVLPFVTQGNLILDLMTWLLITLI
ncbi:uncharacterized protein LOC118227165 isoform X2 [Anguilla anguilla]|uniref:uncharacterized protein LOC118227165 isoform X2 n=1 Tax=Anguilla anguilla TaxID=7936 RepID=UPI0015AC9DCF|nr:uncharacterized protein LOC118227165 isoform X2 [Anguilla anguilla]